MPPPQNFLSYDHDVHLYVLTLWDDILERLNKTSKKLSIKIDLYAVVSVHHSIIRYLRSMFDIYEERANNKLEHKTHKNMQKKINYRLKKRGRNLF